MIDMLRENHIEKTRKAHKCVGCLRVIDPPARMILCVTAQEGTVYNDYFCSTCQMIRQERANGCYNGFFEFSEGDLREEALELEAAAIQIVDAYKNNPNIWSINPWGNYAKQGIKEDNR